MFVSIQLYDKIVIDYCLWIIKRWIFIVFRSGVHWMILLRLISIVIYEYNGWFVLNLIFVVILLTVNSLNYSIRFCKSNRPCIEFNHLTDVWIKHENVCLDLVRWILKILVFLSFDLILVLFNLSFCTIQFEIRNYVKIKFI